MRPRKFETEADLVAAFVREVERLNEVWKEKVGNPSWPEAESRSIWTIYAETCGWDLLLVDQFGVQIGIEAKLSVNAKVLCQALPDEGAYDWNMKGPDYRAILVPETGLQNNLSKLAGHLGLTVITMGGYWNGRRFVDRTDNLPEEMVWGGEAFSLKGWHSWMPAERESLPDYIPDVVGGKAAPVQLTQWKVRAIKLLILLERNGFVTRKDMAHLKISPTRWTAAWHGYLKTGTVKGQYVRCGLTPDLKAQHPTNWPQIEADFEKWAPTA